MSASSLPRQQGASLGAHARAHRLAVGVGRPLQVVDQSPELQRVEGGLPPDGPHYIARTVEVLGVFFPVCACGVPGPGGFEARVFQWECPHVTAAREADRLRADFERTLRIAGVGRR